MAITFPNSPSSGDTHTTSNGLQYTYDGEKWTTIGTNSAGTWTRTGTTVSLTTAGDDLNVDSGTLFVDASANNVGIGTTSPGVPLHVYHATTNGVARFESGDATTLIQFKDNGTTLVPPSVGTVSNSFVVQTNNTERMRIDSSGNVGIGTTSPGSESLVVQKSGSTPTIRINAASTYEAQLKLQANGTVTDTQLVAAKTDGSLAFARWTGAVYSERLRIDSSGFVGIGESSPSSYDSGARNLVVGSNSHTGILIKAGTSSYSNIYFGDGTGAASYRGSIAYNHNGNTLRFGTDGIERMRIDSSGRLGLGTSSPQRNAHFNSSTSEVALKLTNSTSGSGSSDGTDIKYEGLNLTINNRESGAISFETANTERMRIDSSGRLLVGTSSVVLDDAGARIQESAPSGCSLVLHRNATTVSNEDSLGLIRFYSNAGSSNQEHARISGICDGAAGANDKPGRLSFYTTADGASSPTERWRIDKDGTFTNKTSNIGAVTGAGVTLETGGASIFARSGANPVFINRITNDGNLVQFYGDNTLEGNISVNGTTVSYNGGHLSRWSQLASGAARTEILRGSVLSNLDEMCEWGEEDNEQLNRMKVSDAEGDVNVSGVFQAWDDDDDTYTNDFYCAMTGDFVIRIAQGTTVARGDLLMSAGDGTAKPQDDDIIRSKTIAKVTSANVSETYADGSYCVPCVLMAC